MPRFLRAALNLANVTWIAVAGCSIAEESPVISVSQPPLDFHVPMVRVPMAGLRWVDEDLHRNLARCVDDRPLCETGMDCYGWFRIAISIQPDGSVERPRLDSACPHSKPPEDLWEKMLQWRYNPRIQNGVAVEVPATATLAYWLGVSS